MRKYTLDLSGLFILLIATLPVFGQVPDDLTSSRSVVIVDLADQQQKGFTVRGEWKTLAEKAHSKLKRIGVDAILYLNRDDLQAGPEITQVYENVLVKRKVSNLILIQESGEGYEKTYRLKIFDEVDGIKLYEPYYSISSATIDDLMLLLGRQVLRQELLRTNLLILDKPEYLDDLKLYTGNRYPNVPSRLKNQTLAVILFDTIAPPAGISEADLREIAEENSQIKKQNEELKTIMSRYPAKYELVYFTGVPDLYKGGYQYALMPVISSGKTVKKMLDYEINPAETMYVSETQQLNGKPVLKKIPANAVQTKYYLKQTIVGDMHVGRRWDADTSWQISLNNFIDNIIFDLKLEQ